MNLKEKLAALIARQKEIVDGASGTLTSDAQREFDDLQAQIDMLNQLVADEAQRDSESEAETTRAVEAERSRIAEITSLCRDFDMDPTAHISSGTSVDAVRSAILDDLRKNHAPVPSATVEPTGENDFRRDAADALCLRSGKVSVENPTDGARQMSHMSLRDLAAECLAREGKSASELRRMSSDDLYYELSRQFYNPTAAFPSILDSTIRKSIVDLYNKVPTTFQAFTTKGSLSDFKETSDHEYVIGGVGDFLKVPENGEIKADLPRTELLPQRKLDTYAKQFSMTRQAFVNDDIGFLTHVPGLYATAAKKTIDKQVYKILMEGKATNIFDGHPLFDQNTYHKNLALTDSAPTAAAIQAMILQMQKQTDQFGDPIYMTPRTMIVPMGFEFDLAVIFRSAQVVGSSNNDINPLYNYPLSIVQSPVINAMTASGAKAPWFMIADEASARGIQVDYLNGQETPTVRRMEVPGTLGFVWDIWLDWGIAVRDFRGIYRNDGSVIS